MEEIKNFEKYVDNQLLQLEARINLFREFKLMLNSQTLLKGESNPNIVNNKEERPNIEAPVDYPRRGAFTNKIRYMISNHSKAMELKDFKDKLTEFEGEKSNKFLVSFERALRALAHPKHGELIYFHYKNSEQRFYIKHEWLTEDKNDIRPEHMPAPGVINDIPIEAIVPENIVWHKSK